MHKIIIYTAVYKRPEIFKIFLNNLPNDFPLVLVGSRDDECHDVWNNWDAEQDSYWVYHDNIPLGKKWNAGLMHIAHMDFDYILILGSDDILEPKLYEFYKDISKKDYHFIGFEDFYFYDFDKLKYNPGFRYNRKGKSHGAGRLIHRNLLEALEYKLWDDGINSGLDGSTDNKINNLNIKSKLINLRSEDLFAVDLKTKDNIHSLEEYNGSYADLDLLKRIKL